MQPLLASFLLLVLPLIANSSAFLLLTMLPIADAAAFLLIFPLPIADSNALLLLLLPLIRDLDASLSSDAECGRSIPKWGLAVYRSTGSIRPAPCGLSSVVTVGR